MERCFLTEQGGFYTAANEGGFRSPVYDADKSGGKGWGVLSSHIKRGEAYSGRNTI